MAWTFQILRADKIKDKWKSVVKYSNGVTDIKKGYLFDHTDEETLKAQLRAKLAELESFDAAVLPLPLGVELSAEDIPATVPEQQTAPQPTQAEIDKKQWFSDYNDLQKLNELIVIGVMSDTDTEYTTLKSRLATNYLPEYKEDL